jgi:hypothetical protein
VSESRSVVSKSRDNACWPTRFSMPLLAPGVHSYWRLRLPEFITLCAS